MALEVVPFHAALSLTWPSSAEEVTMRWEKVLVAISAECILVLAYILDKFVFLGLTRHTLASNLTHLVPGLSPSRWGDHWPSTTLTLAQR